MRYLISFSCFFITFSINSQLPVRPYEKLELIGVQPIWYETSFDSSLINENCDGYNNLYNWTPIKPLVNNNFVYTIREINTTNNTSEGAYIEKRSLLDGKLMWSILYDSRNLFYQEVPFKMYINEEGFLIVHGFRRRADDQSFFPFLTTPTVHCHLTYRKIDIIKGEIKEFYTPEENDSKAASVIASYERNSFFGDLFLMENKDEFLYWERRIPPVTNPVQTIRFQKVDKFGHALSEVDSVILGRINVVVNLMQKTLDTFLYVHMNVADQKLILYYLNTDFEIMDSVILNSFPIALQNNLFIAEYKHSQKIWIRSFIFNGEAYTVHNVLYDMFGNIIDYVVLKNNKRDFFESMVDETTNKILGMKVRYDENPLRPRMDLFISDQNGGLDIKASWESQDTFRLGYLQDIQRVGTDKVLIELYESSIYQTASFYLYDNNARASSLMLFNAADLGLSSVSSEDVIQNEDQFAVFPNPGYNHVTLTWRLPTTGNLAVYNIWGNKIYQQELIEADYTHMQTATWPPGAYIFVLTDGASGVHTSVKWLKD